MPPGPRPTPTNLKVLRGNPGKRALNKDEPRADVCMPDPPPGLSPAAHAHWEHVVTELAASGVMTKLDVDALRLYCETFATWAQATEILRRSGLFQKTPNGYIVPSPFLSIAGKAQDRMLQILREFGLTPASRSRIKTAGGDKKESDPWEAL